MEGRATEPKNLPLIIDLINSLQYETSIVEYKMSFSRSGYDIHRSLKNAMQNPLKLGGEFIIFKAKKGMIQA
jgi:hypothetical protein